VDDREGCYQRTLADGTVETYHTANTTGFELPEFRACSAELADKVLSIRDFCL
jgi:hypothetical protein